MNFSPDLETWISRYAKFYDLREGLVKAIIEVESAGEIYAWRVEPPYRYLVNLGTGRPFRKLTPAEIASERAPTDFVYDRRLGSRDTEWWGQQASWGPMQVMGAVAREYGFRGRFPELCGDKGVHFGCAYLAALFQRFGWAGLPGVIAAYNAGSPRYTDSGAFVNQGYVSKVFAARDKYIPGAPVSHPS